MTAEMDELKKITELLEKSITFQMYAQNITQNQIASYLGKSKTWVNSQLKGLPHKGSHEGKNENR
jgi:hypothetical protein